MRLRHDLPDCGIGIGVPGSGGRKPEVLDRLMAGLATLWVVGFAPRAPGTAATALAALAVALLNLPALLFAALAVVVAVVGTVAADRAARALGEKDPGCVVIDEVAGYLVATAFVPHSPGYLAAAFVLFRFFDIAKPGPIGRLQNIPGGWGIMADDLAAGLAANILLQIWRVQPWI